MMLNSAEMARALPMVVRFNLEQVKLIIEIKLTHLESTPREGKWKCVDLLSEPLFSLGIGREVVSAVESGFW